MLSRGEIFFVLLGKVQQKHTCIIKSLRKSTSATDTSATDTSVIDTSVIDTKV